MSLEIVANKEAYRAEQQRLIEVAARVETLNSELLGVSVLAFVGSDVIYEDIGRRQVVLERYTFKALETKKEEA
jgi:hypothetical protein